MNGNRMLLEKQNLFYSYYENTNVIESNPIFTPSKICLQQQKSHYTHHESFIFTVFALFGAKHISVIVAKLLIMRF